MHRFSEDAEASVSSGVRVSIRANGDTPRQIAEKKCYRDDSGNLYIPGGNILACLVGAGIHHKSGRSKLTTQKSSLIPAGISVEEMIISLGTTDFEVDSRSVVIPATGGRVMEHRPRLDEWQLTFTLDIDKEMFSEKTVRLLVDDAGRKVGLGDYRPQRKGPFGRFSVVGWNVISQ
jgi:hypothetical protein